ncbi:hypothetical protein QBC40DRAFT_352545 [Triangularia verruculosa]|uniref:BTB domain-containing protein n=1 Tax=Triangularia verruculosa TaxID=2587418 RepID=A0AAN6X8F6_9PEZI|nr:hypothetical protein QBC40DRAFT_352545 [Triangularia verruculosa]
MVIRKFELEAKLKDDNQLIQTGVLRNEHPFETSPEFHDFLLACRRGDLKRCQELISEGVNINGKDAYDYTPLIIASLCGHYELVQLLLESGALADPDSFERERAVYNALNNKIRNLLLSYDYSKTADPLQYWSTHITSLLSREIPPTSDITLSAPTEDFRLHKFILSARSPYFRRKLAEAPDTTSWKLSHNIPVEAFRIVLRYLYLGDLPRDFVTPRSTVTEEEVFKGIDKLCKQLEIDKLWEAVLSNDRRLARQRQQDEVARARDQIAAFFRDTVLKHKIEVDTRKADQVEWPQHNAIFANVLLQADELAEDDAAEEDGESHPPTPDGIPIGPSATSKPTSTTPSKKTRRSVLYPVHKPFLIRSPYFSTMFASPFLESQPSDHLHIIHIDCTPPVLEVILSYLYTEVSTCPLEHALELLYASDMLLLDALKSKAAVTISTLGSGNTNALVDRTHHHDDGTATTVQQERVEQEPINVYDVIRAAWDLSVQRLEEFCARYLASRLEDYIDEPEFHDLIEESALRLESREETDTIELLDDIRYYLGERFRLRFEGEGLEEMLDEEHFEQAVDGEYQGLDLEGPDVGLEELALTMGENDARYVGNGDEAVVEGVERGEEERDEGGVRTLDGVVVEDEFASDAVNYHILVEKIDRMLEKLKLDA